MTNDPYWKMFNPRYKPPPAPPVPESQAKISAPVPNPVPESYAQISAPEFTKQEKNYMQLIVNLIMIPLWALIFWPVAVVWLFVALFVWSYRMRQRSRDRWLVENLRRQNNNYNPGGDVF